MKAIEVNQLKVRFGAKAVLKGLSLTVSPGTICGLLGPNGVGKTTLIKSLVDIIRPQSGKAALMGVPSVELSPAEFQRIGYVSENQELPLWMRVDEFLDYCSRFYPRWDKPWCARKIEEYELPQRTRLQDLSRGMRVKASLISSLSYHPELLILDEPFSGLDPLMRDDLLDLVIELSTENRAATLISSHDLAEVERVADSIAFLLDGQVRMHRPLDDLLHSFRRVTVALEEAPKGKLPADSGWYDVKLEQKLLTFVDPAFCLEEVHRRLLALGCKGAITEAVELDLKGIYRALAARSAN